MNAKAQHLSPNHDMLQVALIKAAHGIKGLVRVKSFTEPANNLFNYAPLFDEKGVVHSLALSHENKGEFICRFDAINDRDIAQDLSGSPLYIARDQLPDLENDDEFYHTDLIDLMVKNTDGDIVGKILRVDNFGADDLLDIALSDDFLSKYNANASQKQAYIPFTKAIVPHIDLKDGSITIQKNYMDHLYSDNDDSGNDDSGNDDSGNDDFGNDEMDNKKHKNRNDKGGKA